MNTQLDQSTDFIALEREINQKLYQCILAHIEKEQMTIEQAQDLAKEFVAKRDAGRKEDLINILNELGKHYPAAQETYLAYARPQEDAERSSRLNQLTTLIHAGKLDEAIRTLHEEK